MKVKVEIRGTVSYIGELKMTRTEYEKRIDQLETARGSLADTLAHDLIEEIGLSLADPTEWGDLEVDTFEEVI